jgi:hypothetical protein
MTTPSGDKFVGWSMTPGGSVVTISNDTTLYAVWSSSNAGAESFPILSALPSYFEKL